MRRKRLLTSVERLYVIDLARGLTARQSAAVHGVSVWTVMDGLKRARIALGARTGAQLVFLALAEGEMTTRNVMETDDE